MKLLSHQPEVDPAALGVLSSTNIWDQGRDIKERGTLKVPADFLGSWEQQKNQANFYWDLQEAEHLILARRNGRWPDDRSQGNYSSGVILQ